MRLSHNMPSLMSTPFLAYNIESALPVIAVINAANLTTTTLVLYLINAANGRNSEIQAHGALMLYFAHAVL